MTSRFVSHAEARAHRQFDGRLEAAEGGGDPGLRALELRTLQQEAESFRRIHDNGLQKMAEARAMFGPAFALAVVGIVFPRVVRVLRVVFDGVRGVKLSCNDGPLQEMKQESAPLYRFLDEREQGAKSRIQELLRERAQDIRESPCFLALLTYSDMRDYFARHPQPLRVMRYGGLHVGTSVPSPDGRG